MAADSSKGTIEQIKKDPNSLTGHICQQRNK